MGEYAFYSFTDETLLQWDSQTLPVPVRLERQGEIFGGQKVRMDLLLDELRLFLDEYPDMAGVYDQTVEVLTLLAGVNSGLEGDHEAAARFLDMGLEANPDSLLLRSNYALSLQLLNRPEEAIEEYEVVLADPQGRQNPMVRLLAARLYAENGEYLDAYHLLDEIAEGVPAEDSFWDFLAEMKELAGVERPDEGKTTAMPAQPRAGVCPACGRPLRPGSVFCRGCGAKVAGGGTGRTYCPECGSRLRHGATFCTKCGKQL